MSVTKEQAIEAYQTIIQYMEPDTWNREGLKDSPKRALKALEEMLSGYSDKDPSHILLSAQFSANYDEIILVKDIRFTSLCEHHLLPFSGVAHVAYIPKGQVVGLSKIPRLVDAYAKRMQLQERLTQQVADCLYKVLTSQLKLSDFTTTADNLVGAACIIQAKHSCMGCRGVMKPEAEMRTSVVRGLFRNIPQARQELFSLIGN